MTSPDLRRRAEELIRELRLGIMATPKFITVKEEWRIEVLLDALTTVQREATEKAHGRIMGCRKCNQSLDHEGWYSFCCKCTNILEEERETCAKVVEELHEIGCKNIPGQCGCRSRKMKEAIATAIRERGKDA